MKISSLAYNILYFLLLCLACPPVLAQRGDVYVDKQGVMRWGNTKEEVHGFGINYTAPFAHAYRSAKALNVNLEHAIDDDVYHFARLGFDAFRVHVWDTEISDTVGNLLANEHLRLFDYMLMRMKERGMKLLLTPIAFWGNGYPERDEHTPGFAFKYGKDACLTNEQAIRAQENYLFQFLSHVNPYTNVAYKDDPDIVAFEVSNEPHHKGTPAEVTTFINRMVKAMKKTGCKKPFFYNISHSIHLGKAYFDAGIQGGTFQWYPTGLGARHELRGNFLPNVDRYTMPFTGDARFASIAKIVYEFDAADVGRSYIYPAMARSFREAGIQWATHFAYDPTYMAYANTEYNTHYMNLVYAPQKALSLKIAGEVFHHMPMYKNYGRYPNNTTFDAFRVSYDADLAEMVTDTKFIYTNNTTTAPPAPAALQEVSGFGNSPIVTYEGKGAYFLDKIENGVWRLEVMPDAIWIDNPFGKNSLKKAVAVVSWASWPMQVNLPDLGRDFSITALNDGTVTVQDNIQSFQVQPGVYLLVKKGVTPKVKATDKWKNIRIDEFVAPKVPLRRSYVLHTPPQAIMAGMPLKVEAAVVTSHKPDAVSVYVSSPFGNKVVAMHQSKAYHYEALVPEALVQQGYLYYYIAVTHNGVTHTFPSGVEGEPVQWDFYDDKPFKVAVVAAGMPLYLFDAAADAEQMSREWRKGSNLLPGGKPGAATLAVKLPALFKTDPENLNGEKINDYSLRYNFSEKIKGRAGELPAQSKLVIRAGSLGDSPVPLQVALVTKNGHAYGALITLQDQVIKEYTVHLSALKPVKLVTLPRPYPTFLPYYFESAAQPGPLEVKDAETLQISVGPGIENSRLQADLSFALESIRME